MRWIRDIDAEFGHRRMIQEERAQRVRILALAQLAEVSIFAHRYRLASAATMEREPSPAVLDPFANEVVLLVSRIWPRDISDQETTARQPLRDVAVVVRRCRQQLRILVQHA